MKTIMILCLSTLLTGLTGANTSNTPERPLIEVIDASITDHTGNAIDQDGYYIKYDNQKFKNGDNARTIIVYNPHTNYVDDVICRIDMEVKK